MISSMTAYARSEKTESCITVTAEIRSYNSKYLDISLRTPHGYESLESRIKERVSSQISRGRIEILVRIKDESENAFSYEIDKPKAKAYYQALSELKNLLGIKEEISLELIANSMGIIRPVETGKNFECNWPIIQGCLDDAITNLKTMREKEGAYLKKDFLERLDGIEQSIQEIEALSENLIPIYKQRLEERIITLTKGIVEMDMGRISQEAAFLADRSDISEEIVRSRSHVEQFREILAGQEPAGRKLNFLLQEFNREFNTMGAKAIKTEIAHTIVAVKSELEKIREQVQNVE
ncbi:MAG: YicC family protein [Desulfobacterium sp.]|nr:YicC family protein [Desulfobacterium sp.]